MAAQATQAKVLRIGIIQDGKIVQERLIKQGESVTVGESPKNTFVLPKTHLPRADFPLFVNKSGAYQLHFTTEMKGKISSGGAVVALDALRSDPSVNQQGGVYRLPLSESDRGKLSVDGVTVLFQFVPPPPVQAAQPLERMDFRPAWFDSDDPALFGFLGLFSSLAVVFAVGIYLAPEPPEQNFEQYRDRFTQVMQHVEKDLVEPEVDDDLPEIEDLNPDREEAKAKEDPKEAPKAEAKSKQPPRSEVDAAKQREQALQAMRDKRRVLQIGSRGDKTRGSVSEAFDGDTLDSLAGLSGDELAAAGEASGTRGSGDYQTGDMEVDGDVDVGGVAASEASSAPAFKVAVDPGKGDTFELDGSGEGVESKIRQLSGQLQACYEAELRADPSLEGRIEVRFNISRGRVTTANVSGNTSGNASLGECVAKRVKRWRFDEDVNGPLTWSWMFRKR